MNRKEIEETIKRLQDEYDYFKKRYNEETDWETKDTIWFCAMLAEAGMEEYKLQLENLTVVNEQ